MAAGNGRAVTGLPDYSGLLVKRLLNSQRTISTRQGVFSGAKCALNSSTVVRTRRAWHSR